MTKTITTIGPASEDIGTLMYFAEHNVEIARLNFSHNTPDWHIQTGKKARQAGLKLLADVSGPKIRLGDLHTNVTVAKKNRVVFEKQSPEHEYPRWLESDGEKLLVLPTLLDLSPYLKSQKIMLVDDGKVEFVVEKVVEDKIYAEVIFGGVVKSHKGINLPETDIKINFLTKRDEEFLSTVLPVLKPEIVAVSFVKTVKDLEMLKDFVTKVLAENQISDYFPKICTKLEMGEAVKDQNLEAIVDFSDLIMIARGDLALEAHPLHINVPFNQEKIKQICKQKNKQFIVATQVLESMIENPVPTRAEVSDLYRAVVLDKADFVMLSAESATGKYTRKCVDLMQTMSQKAE